MIWLKKESSSIIITSKMFSNILTKSRLEFFEMAAEML